MTEKICPTRLIAWNIAVQTKAMPITISYEQLDSMIGDSTPECVAEKCAMWDDQRDRCGLIASVTCL